MRPHGVVVNPPGVDDVLRLRDAEKPVLVQALVAKLSIEALHVGVRDRFARTNEAQLDPAAIRSRVQGPTGEFGSVVADEHVGKPDRFS